MTKREQSLICEALMRAEMREVRLMDKFPDVAVSHSKEYEENMQSLLASRAKKTRRLTKKQLIAAIIAAAIILLVTACAFIPPISNFFEEVFESFTKLSATEESQDSTEEIYVPTYIPGNYIQMSKSIKQLVISIIWSNGNDRIIYYQTPLNNENTSIDTEANQYSLEYIGEQPVYYIYKSDVYFFVWENDHYSFKLKCPDTLPFEEMIKIIDSIEISEE